MQIIQIAIEKLSNSMRIYDEHLVDFQRLFKIDQEEAINNLDRAFEAKLEAFHSLYDITQNEYLDFFEHADTALLILLRNALHHRDHLLFHSWNSELYLNDGLKKMSGASFLMTNFESEEEGVTYKHYLKITDFLERLDTSVTSKFLSNKQKKELLQLCDEELSFQEIINHSKSERYPISQVYLNMAPIFVSAVSRVFSTISSKGISVKGFDSDVYLEHFTSIEEINFSMPKYWNITLP